MLDTVTCSILHGKRVIMCCPAEGESVFLYTLQGALVTYLLVLNILTYIALKWSTSKQTVRGGRKGRKLRKA